VLANGFVDASGMRLDLDLQFSPGGFPSAPDLHVGRLAASERILGRPGEKRAYGAQTGALAVDLESFAIARACERLGARFLAVRVISDAVGDELPPEIDHLARQKSVAGQLGAAAGAIFRKPSSLKQMLKLKEDSLVASDKLARFLSNLIRHLPKADPDERRE
jgi:adenosylhomocysteine nucleosidase